MKERRNGRQLKSHTPDERNVLPGSIFFTDHFRLGCFYNNVTFLFDFVPPTSTRV